MTTVTKLEAILNTKENIKTSIRAKGVKLSDTDPFSVYPSKIDAIKTVDTGGDLVDCAALGDAKQFQSGDKVLLNQPDMYSNDIETSPDIFTTGVHNSNVNTSRGYINSSYLQLRTLSNSQAVNGVNDGSKYSLNNSSTWNYIGWVDTSNSIGLGIKQNGTSSGSEANYISIYNKLNNSFTQLDSNRFNSVEWYSLKGFVKSYINLLWFWDGMTLHTVLSGIYSCFYTKYNDKDYIVVMSNANTATVYEFNRENITASASSDISFNNFSSLSLSQYTAFKALDEEGNYVLKDGKILKVNKETTTWSFELIASETSKLSLQSYVETLPQSNTNDGLIFTYGTFTGYPSLYKFKDGVITELPSPFVEEEGFDCLASCAINFQEGLVAAVYASTQNSNTKVVVKSYIEIPYQFIATNYYEGYFTQDTLTGFVKENKGAGLMDTTVLSVSTALDPNADDWTNVGKLFGFNIITQDALQFRDLSTFGTVNITDDGVASGFSSTNYIYNSKQIPSSVTSFEGVVCFETDAFSSNQEGLGWNSTDGQGVSLHIYPVDRKIYVYTSGGDKVTSDPLSAGVKYWFKLSWDGETYTASLSTNGVDYTVCSTASLTTFAWNEEMRLGQVPGWSRCYFSGKIYLEECYIKMNNEIFWNTSQQTNEGTITVSQGWCSFGNVEYYIQSPITKTITELFDGQNKGVNSVLYVVNKDDGSSDIVAAAGTINDYKQYVKIADITLNDELNEIISFQKA